MGDLQASLDSLEYVSEIKAEVRSVQVPIRRPLLNMGNDWKAAA